MLPGIWKAWGCSSTELCIAVQYQNAVTAVTAFWLYQAYRRASQQAQNSRIAFAQCWTTVLGRRCIYVIMLVLCCLGLHWILGPVLPH